MSFFLYPKWNSESQVHFHRLHLHSDCCTDTVNLQFNLKKQCFFSKYKLNHIMLKQKINDYQRCQITGIHGTETS